MSIVTRDMFYFITSLRHPGNCNSYDRVSFLLENTLRSVCKQTSENFKVLVVCNKIPAINVNKSVEFLEVDFPAPSSLNRAQTGMEAIRSDRGYKYMAGLIYIRPYNPSYVMFFDADDFISNRIVEFVTQQKEKCGWYIETGYQFQTGDTHLSSMSNFHHHCGTSLIYPYSMLEIPSGLAGEVNLSSIKRYSDENYLKNVLGSHRAAVMIHQSWGYSFRPLPFPCAIWILGTGENHSGKNGHPGDIAISNEISNEFSFFPAEISAIRGI